MTKVSKKSALARKWIATIYRFNDGRVVDETTRLDWNLLSEHVRFLTYQVEKCPESGRLHLQCYMEIRKQVRRKRFLEIFDYKGYCDPAYFPDGAAEYPHKEDSRIAGPWTHGVREKKNGDRTDLEEVADLVKNGATLRDVAEKFPTTVIQYSRGIKELIYQLKSSPRDASRPPQVICIIGPPGTGKTSRIFSHYPAHEIWNGQFDNGFANGYENQRVVLFDDFDWQTVRFHHLLKLFDRYPITTNVKGHYLQWNPEIIVVTNNTPPDKWYAGQGHNMMSLIRRFTKIIAVRSSMYRDVKGEYLPEPPTLIPFDASASLPSLENTSSCTPSVPPPSPNLSTSASNLEEDLERCPQL